MFDSITGQMLTKQVIIVTGERITEVGPEGKVTIPAGMRVIDLTNATVLPGFIDTHTHVFNTRGKMTSDESMLLAVENVRANLLAGFTSLRDMGSHGNGFQDVDLKNAINRGSIDGPRMLVSGRGIAWGAVAAKPGAPPPNNLGNIPVNSAEEGRAAVREVLAAGAEHIKLYPTGGYKFDEQGVPQYPVTYPLEVLQAILDETHKHGKRAGCHSFGGLGLQNTVVAGCDSVEHGYSLTQEMCDLMAKKNLYYDPTLVRYTEPYMDDNDAKNTAGRFRMIPHFEANARRCIATKGVKTVPGDRRRRIDVCPWHAGPRIRGPREAGRHDADRCVTGRHHQLGRVDAVGESRRVDHQGQVRRHRRGVGRSDQGHQRDAAGEVRDEGWRSVQERSDVRHAGCRIESMTRLGRLSASPCASFLAGASAEEPSSGVPATP